MLLWINVVNNLWLCYSYRPVEDLQYSFLAWIFQLNYESFLIWHLADHCVIQRIYVSFKILISMHIIPMMSSIILQICSWQNLFDLYLSTTIFSLLQSSTSRKLFESNCLHEFGHSPWINNSQVDEVVAIWSGGTTDALDNAMRLIPCLNRVQLCLLFGVY